MTEPGRPDRFAANAGEYARFRPTYPAALPDIVLAVPGAAALPAADVGLRAVTAATAAHWFGLPAFLAEVRRALAPSSHARTVGERLGRDETCGRLVELAESLGGGGGSLPPPWRPRIGSKGAGGLTWGVSSPACGRR